MTDCVWLAKLIRLAATFLLLAALAFDPGATALAQDLSSSPVAPLANGSAHPSEGHGSPPPVSAPEAAPAQPESARAPNELPAPAKTARTDLPRDLSPWGMFMAADSLVKAVMIGLALASLATWTILLAKTIELAGARGSARRTLDAVREARTMGEALTATDGNGGPAREMLAAAAREAALSDAAVDHAGGEGLKQRVQLMLSRIEASAGRRISQGTGVLATIGSIAPFVGLFGTVWGIMNSFVGISKAQTTNLAVVAPGIAEALLATAIGLVAAIPAVIVYNAFVRRIQAYRALLGDVAAGVLCLVSRDLDYRKVPSSRVVRFGQAAE
jgi:biopolymer transport protein ExbB